MVAKQRSMRFSDEEWEMLKKQGAYFGLSRSRYIVLLLNSKLEMITKGKIKGGK